MQKPFFYGVGGVLSADIAVPNHESELAFYSKVLTTGNNPLWRDDLMNNQGTPIIGLGARTPEYDRLPLQWMPHFQVADVAASAANAVERGGKELMHGKDDNGLSQWAVITDPDGAAFGIIPALDADLDNSKPNERFGCIGWLSLMVPDAMVSRDFYQQVVGWRAKSCEAEHSVGKAAGFEMQIDNENSAAKISEFPNELNGVPSTWLIHLPVDDIAESLKRVIENDGEIISECTEQKYAIIRDPVGVYFALIIG
jgi:predicted enzyme related to lactoylglutathione lyase